MSAAVEFLQGLELYTLLIAVLIVIIFSWWWSQPKNLPPGPLQWPLVGSLPSVAWAMYRSGVHPSQVFAQQSRIYGKMYCMYIGSKLVIVLNGHEVIREAFLNPLLNDRPALMHQPNSIGVALVNGNMWKRQRRFTLSTFRDFGIGKSRFQDKISEEAEFVTEEFRSRMAKPFDPKHILTNAISNVICAVIFGKRFQYSDADFKTLLSLIDRLVALTGAGGFLSTSSMPIIKFFKFGSGNKMQKVVEEIRSFITKIINEHKSNFDSDNLNDYMDVYLKELQGDDNLDETSLLQTVLQLFVAGTETTVTTLRWGLLYMMKFPDIQLKIQQEIDSVVGRNRLPRMSDNLPYTEATIMEVQRIGSILPLGVPHCAAEDTTIQGFNIPKGSALLSNIWAVHHDPDLWSEPEEFNPERFLNENGVVSQPGYYIPFCTGRRNCLGENLARMELFICFTHLIHRFSFSKPEGSPPLSLKGSMEATNAPQPFEMKITERD